MYIKQLIRSSTCIQCTRQQYLPRRTLKTLYLNKYVVERGYSSIPQKDPGKRSWFGIEWFFIPASVGFGVICFLQFKHIIKRNNDVSVEEDNQSSSLLKPWQLDLVKKIPTRAASRFWGYCCDTQLPLWLRKPLINTYSKLFKCNLEEALVADVTKYETFNKFFTRKLRQGVRPIDSQATVVSPADCTVLSLGRVSRETLELDQIKGFSYPLNLFTGPRHPFLKKTYQYFEAQSNEDFDVFYCSLYLGPGDYHWFHSPTEWTVEHRRHIPGHLFSVDPRVLRRINGIFNFNERVLLSGHWEWGIFLYGAIGAFNVGSVKLNFKTEKDLQTNSRFSLEGFKDRIYGSGILMKRGEAVGRFELGSSIVLVFTAPTNFEFNVIAGQKLKYGQPLGSLNQQEDR